MRKWKWIAEVGAKKKNGAFELSTGAPLSRRYVLVSGHGLPEKQGGAVKIRFIDDFENDRGWREAEIVWHGGKKIDAALLMIDEVKDLIPFIYSSDIPERTMDWEGAGFPAASTIKKDELKDGREIKGLNGKFLPGGGLKQGMLDLTVKSPPRDPKKWAGVSGAPVLCDGKLIGLIKSYPGEFDGNTLDAVPFQRLWAIDAFRKLFADQDFEDAVTAVKDKIVQVLENSENARQALRARQALKDVPDNARKLVDKLFNLKPETFIISTYKASQHAAIVDEASRNAVEEVLCIALPMMYDPGFIASVRANVSLGVLLPLPAATRTVAEIIMAGIDGRPLHFITPIDPKAYPFGASCIETPPEAGVGGEAFIKAFDEHMINEFVADEDSGYEIDILRELVNDRLEHIAYVRKEYTYRYYFIYSSEQHARHTATIAELRRCYPQLIFIHLALPDKAVPRERKLANPLRDFFAKNEEGRKQ